MKLFVRSLKKMEVERHMMTNGLILRTLQPEAAQSTLPEVLIIALFSASDGPGRAERLARQWQPMVPGGEFLGIECEDLLRNINVATLQRIVAEGARARDLTPDQVLLLGLRKAGRSAVELVLHGVLKVAGVIAYDIPLPVASEPFQQSAAAFRLVQQPSSADPINIQFHALVRRLQRQDIDVRAVILPDDASYAGDMPMRAGSSFLIELVAKAIVKPR